MIALADYTLVAWVAVLVGWAVVADGVRRHWHPRRPATPAVTRRPRVRRLTRPFDWEKDL